MKKTTFRPALCLVAGLNLAAAALLTSAFAQDPTTDTLWHGKAEVPHYAEKVFPPWQHGENNDATQRGFEFTVPEVDDLADFHGDITDPKLVLYVGGNYFFAMAPILHLPFTPRSDQLDIGRLTDPAFAGSVSPYLACIAHKSLEIFERCRLWQQNSPATPDYSAALLERIV
jgi:hypothetical protein